MLHYYCWLKNITHSEFQTILKEFSIRIDVRDCAFDEKKCELCMIIAENKLPNHHVDDIINDLERVLNKKIDCHINVCDEKKNLQCSVIQKDGFRTINIAQ